jgi:hypothetical protein
MRDGGIVDKNHSDGGRIKLSDSEHNFRTFDCTVVKKRGMKDNLKIVSLNNWEASL